MKKKSIITLSLLLFINCLNAQETKSASEVTGVTSYENKNYIHYENAYDLYNVKKYTEALNEINLEIKSDSIEIRNFFLKAYILANLKDYQNVIKTVNKALEIDSKNDELYDLKGSSFSFLGKHEEAFLAYEKALAFEKFDARYYNNYLSVLAKERKTDKMIEVYHIYLDSKKNLDETMENDSQFENDILFYAALGYYYNNMKDKSLELLNRAIEIRPNYSGYYSNRANIYSDKKDFTNAILDYNKAISLSPMDGRLYYNRGNVYLDIEKYNEALKDFKSAEKNGENDSDLYQNMGNAYKGLKKYDEALNNYKKAIDINPDNKQVYNNLAILYKVLGRKEDSEIAYKKATENGSESFIPYFNQGCDAMKIYDYKAAIPFLIKAIEIKPDLIEAFNQLGICYSELGDDNLALETYTKGIIKKNDFEIIYLNRGNSYKNLEKYSEAKKDYLEALKLNPKMVIIYYVIAKMYFNLNDYKQAQEYFRLAEEGNVDVEDYFIDYVSFLISNKQYIKALEIAEKGNKIHTKSYGLLVNLALCYADNNQINKAILTLKEAIKVNPNESSAYYNLGNYYFLQKKDLKNAENYYLLAIEKNTLSSEPYLNLASVYQDMNEESKMMETMQKLIQKFPNSYSAYYNLAEFVNSKGNTKLAITYFEKSFDLMDMEIKNSTKNAYDLNIEKSEKSLLKAQAYQNLLMYEQAIPAFQMYLAFNSDNDIAYANYGFCLFEKGNLNDALINFEKAYKINDKEIDTIIGLITTNYLLKNNSAVNKYLKLIKNKFKNYKLNDELLENLIKEGYSYNDKIITTWKNVISEMK